MIDRETLSERLDALDDYLHKLESLKPVTLDDLERNFRLRWEVERGLELVCNCVLDVTNHLVSALRLGVARDQTEALRLLATRPDIVPPDLIARLNGLPGFRNVLAHEYLTIDLSEVHRVFSEDLSDLAAFGRYVHAFLMRQP